MTTEMEVCPVCGAGHLQHQAIAEPFEYKGATLEALDYHDTCDVCGTEMASPEQIKDSARAMNRAKIAHDGLLDGASIRAFREDFNLTQKQAADLFGGGPTAFAKYESDEIAHNVAMDRLLRLCRDNPGNIAALARISGVDLPLQVRAAVHDAMASKLQDILSEVAEAFDYEVRPMHESANDGDFEQYAEVMTSVDDFHDTSWAEMVA